jgi:hypothetical protein
MLSGSYLMEDKKPQPSWVRQFGLFSVIVADLAGYTGAGIALGYLAWKKLGAPWWVLPLTSLIGLTLAMVKLHRMSRKDME